MCCSRRISSVATEDRSSAATEDISSVATEERLSIFLSEGLSVLTNAGRIQLTQQQDSDILISIDGSGINDTNRDDRITVIVPPMDATLLPGLNRSLNSAGIPWQYEFGEQQGELGITQWNGPVDLSEIRIRSHYLLTPKQVGLEKDILAYLSSGEPWLVEGTTSKGPYLLLASDLEQKSTNLTVTAAMIPFLEWTTTHWDHHTDRSENIFAGESINTLPGTTAIRDPQGNLHPIDKIQTFRNTRWTGLYEISTSQGYEIWRWLLVTVVLVLLAESIVAASGPAAIVRNSVPAIRTAQDPKSF